MRNFYLYECLTTSRRPTTGGIKPHLIMKILLILFAAGALILGLSYCTGNPDYITEDAFNKAHTEVIAEIDTLKAVLRNVERDLALVKADVAEIKTSQFEMAADIAELKKSSKKIEAGQVIIYNETKKPNSPSFEQRLAKYLFE